MVATPCVAKGGDTETARQREEKRKSERE